MSGLFDALVGEALKADGMARAAESRADLLREARELAVNIACSRADRTCTADDVQQALAARGVDKHRLGKAAGSLFVGDGWEFTGRFVKSTRPHAHRNLLRVWKLKEPT
jgi:hypothetical protein